MLSHEEKLFSQLWLEIMTKTFRSLFVTIVCLWAGAIVQWLWEKTHVLKVMDSNPNTVPLYGHFSHKFVVRIVMYLFEKTKINEKEAGNVP